MRNRIEKVRERMRARMDAEEADRRGVLTAMGTAVPDRRRELRRTGASVAPKITRPMGRAIHTHGARKETIVCAEISVSTH